MVPREISWIGHISIVRSTDPDCQIQSDESSERQVAKRIISDYHCAGADGPTILKRLAILEPILASSTAKSR